ncbi:CocE/NonD family hydrolase [Streptomyces sp. NPDC001508]|uniref:CocE/NonD family hydrolase n=1 Tax=Streptomyces sp. NPDC001508 TaxID=3154656 RepID=UPI00332E3C41
MSISRRWLLRGSAVAASGTLLVPRNVAHAADAPNTATPTPDSIFRFDLRGEATLPHKVGPLESVYVTMGDGVKIALDIVRPAGDDANTKRGTILVMTRYWRGRKGQPSNSMAELFVPHGYAVVVGDCRGTGASFGVSLHERSLAQVKDFSEVLDWIAAQPWSTGSVVGYGHSSPGNMAEFMAVHGNPALKGIIPESDDYDGYETIFPNGVPSTVTWPAWSKGIYDQDHNIGSPGVRPVGADGEADLEAAVREHTAAPLWEGLKQITFRDDRPTTWAGASLLEGYIQEFADKASRSGTPTQYWAGWFDAATPEGAARRFVQMSNPMSVIIGPWPHGYDKPYDPLRPDNEAILPTVATQKANVMHFADLCLNGQAAREQGKVLHYYTLGEGAWKWTRSWPPPAIRRRWYMASGFRLTSSPGKTGFDSFQVDPELGDVPADRWTSTSSTKVNYGDRRQFDAARLAYTSEPLTRDLEITGHPVVHLNITSTREDGNFFVYLEAVRPDGVSCYLTEGQLRALHRKVWADSPFDALGPQHSCLERDAEPLTPGKPATLDFALQPISARLPKGYRLRVCLAGSNKTRFAHVPADGAPPLLNFRRGLAGCYIDLPVVRA